MPPDDTKQPSRLRAYLELVRLPNLFTAVADVAMGVLFVRAVAGPSDITLLAVLATASVLLYAAGVVLNDLFDIEVDRLQRPDRPLPSGRVSLRAARWLGWSLIGAGVLMGCLAAAISGHFRPAIAAVLLAGSVLLYDGLLKRTPLGPLAMGACRMFNVLLGMSVAATPLLTQHWLVAGGIGTYIAGVTWFARTEARQSNRIHLFLATGLMMAGVGLLVWFTSWAQGDFPPRQLAGGKTLLTVLGILIAWRCLRTIAVPTPRQVQATVKQCILTLVVFDAAVTFATSGPYRALAVLALLVPAVVLGRWVYST